MYIHKKLVICGLLMLMVVGVVLFNEPPQNGTQSDKVADLMLIGGSSVKASVIPAWFTMTSLGVMTTTGYSSTLEETDSTPFITASNQRVRDGIVANNCLPFGSRLLIDDEVFEVQDRMNKRYGCERLDIWFSEKELAKNWGLQNKEVYLIE